MKNAPIYIRSIEVENIKTFGGLSTISFENSDGILSQWTIILGDNGIGKSTLLHSIAWMKPDFTVNPDETYSISPPINQQDNESLQELVRKTASTGKMRATFDANRQLYSKMTGQKLAFCTSSIEIDVDETRRLKDVQITSKSNNENIFRENEAVIFCYSASRTLGYSNIANPNMLESVEAFLEDDTELYDAEEILHTIHYATLGASKKDEKRYRAFFDKVKELMVEVLPDIETIKDIEVSAPKLVDGQMRSGDVRLSTKHGKSIAFADFSLGYKTVVAWVIDLSWRLFNRYSKSSHPLAEPAIVIVDEIDLHLHPLWQKEIIGNLSKIFPRVQFIASAHSPLMVQAALKQNFAVLRYENGAVEILNEPKKVDGWRIDQILTSELFGLESARGAEYDLLSSRQEALLNKNRLTATEKKELNDLTRTLAQLPVGETPAEIENRALVAAIAEKVKAGQIKIKL